MRHRMIPALALLLTLSLCPCSAQAKPGPQIIISIQNGTLRLERGEPGGRQIFPVSVGRLQGGEETTPLGTVHTGPDPRDRNLYIPNRKLPAFHRGLPNLRLELRGKVVDRRPSFPFGIHGPVAPSLIWGRASRGCIRMRARGIRALYRFASKHPALPVRIIPGPDHLEGESVATPDPVSPARKGCPEAALGVRRLTRLGQGKGHHRLVCGGVDHWYALELSGGDQLNLKLEHGGGLRLELYGIRGISTVARGAKGISYTVPLARNNRGDRFIRVVAPKDPSRVVPYTLEAIVGGRGGQAIPRSERRVPQNRR